MKTIEARWHSLSCVCERCLSADCRAIAISGYDSDVDRWYVDAKIGAKSKKQEGSRFSPGF